MTRQLLMVCLAAALAGCASTHKDKTASKDPPPVSPTTRFAATLTHTPDEIRLAPHATGLSPAQAAAVADLADRWRDAGDGPVTIQAPAGGGEDAFHSASAVQGALIRLGLPGDQVHLVSYRPPDGASGILPIVVGFTRYVAQAPACGRKWEDFTKTFSNQTNSNFGCAVTANFAAMIAHPADLAGPQAMDPSDANRRETILGKYRKGDIMSSTKDPQANGAVSAVLQ